MDKFIPRRQMKKPAIDKITEKDDEYLSKSSLFTHTIKSNNMQQMQNNKSLPYSDNLQMGKTICNETNYSLS